MFFSSFATILVAASAAQAVVLPRASPNCVTVATGYLSADVQGQLKSFTTLDNDMVSYKGDGKNPLKVEFQACLKPGEHLGTGGGGGVYTGRLFVPGVKKCVDIRNQHDPTPPYFPTVDQCQETGTDVLPIDNQKFIYQTAGGPNIYFLGKSYDAAHQPQGNCALGFIGFQANRDGVPTNTKQGQVSLGCYNMGTQAFRLSDKSA